MFRISRYDFKRGQKPGQNRLSWYTPSTGTAAQNKTCILHSAVEYSERLLTIHQCRQWRVLLVTLTSTFYDLPVSPRRYLWRERRSWRNSTYSALPIIFMKIQPHCTELEIVQIKLLLTEIQVSARVGSHIVFSYCGFLLSVVSLLFDIIYFLTILSLARENECTECTECTEHKWIPEMCLLSFINSFLVILSKCVIIKNCILKHLGN